MAAKYETGIYLNRGFLPRDSAGYCAILDSWLTASSDLGGAGWSSVDDFSTAGSSTFTIPNPLNDQCYCVGHNLSTGHELSVRSATTLPGGLAINTIYFAVRIDADNIRLATTLANALAGTYIDITSAGTGIHTLHRNPFKVYSNVSSPLLNQPVKFLRASYNYDMTATGFTDAIRVMGCLWWDSVNHIPRGIWNQHYLSVRSGASDTYFFAGNTQSVALVVKNNTLYNQYQTGTWVGDPSLIEPVSAVGTLQSGITAGSSVVCSLGSGQAINFSVNKWYFIYDFNSHSWVDYVRLSAVDTGLDTVTLLSVSYSFPAGSIIGAYPHRFYSLCSNVVTTGSTGASDNMNYYRSTMPYISSTSGVPANVFHNQTGLIKVSCAYNFYSPALMGSDPDDEGHYYTQLPIISEYNRGDSTVDPTGLRILGKVGTGDLYVSSIVDMTNAGYRSIDSTRYAYYGTTASLMATGGDNNTVVLVQAQNT